MARPLDSTASLNSAPPNDPNRRVGRLDRAAARAFAAAISSLIVATLVVSHSSAALNPQGTVSGNNFEAGSVVLVDDDRGQSLVNLANMAPNRPTFECIVVTYEGSILPVQVSLVSTSEGPLADYLDIEIERGDGGEFGSCDGFRPLSILFNGTMTELNNSDPLSVSTVRNQGEEIAFRFRFELRDDERAVAQAASVDFVWQALP